MKKVTYQCDRCDRETNSLANQAPGCEWAVLYVADAKSYFENDRDSSPSLYSRPEHLFCHFCRRDALSPIPGLVKK